MNDALASSSFVCHPHPAPASAERLAEVLANPGFGQNFTDHMTRVTWTADQGWHDARLVPYGPLEIMPSTSVLHYAQEIFEGMKCYRHPDDSVWAFRPSANGERLAASARRLALPELPMELFMESVRLLVDTDKRWVPAGGENSLYLRPFMFGSEAGLGVRPSNAAEYLCIASPSASIFKGGVTPVSIWVSQEYTRAALGGTGEAKCGGNYAASLLATREAQQNGCDQVVFLDAEEHRWLEELGGMNIMLVTKDNELITPELTGTILRGITRNSLLTLAREAGMKVTERKIDVAQWRDGVQSGEITEAFACGTAAVITPIGALVDHSGRYETPQSGIGPVASHLRKTLLDIQYGRAEDKFGWMVKMAD